ncbi:MAG TPA: GH92 family glycosyl hydrolase [Bacteroidales bacterium]|nr:GH92 family glycosyl hydrolase [Bacteroidales bacterium]HPF02132.1 GH92 family glycosyl hydrolase [Bacteroidales bacterium]HPJ58143.1 GH92 family glycosyl hydrolase [Bacteroidales bacterium]HPR11474.1 GH92 family glycosyl hydrolase [Bacteroidales bacterium]HRW84553.1 GH92 family glycosyl hydrolase [Bacteroidales bacterium]
MKTFYALIATFLILSSGCTKPKDPVDYVDPFIGTDFFGHTFPGPSLPYAMVHLSPDVYTQGWTYCAGYVYSGSSIMGFSHTHWSGVGMVDGGDILIMPDVGDKLRLTPGPPDNPDEGYRSRFDHEDETASAGYYSVFLKDCGVLAELTSTRRAGFHRYTFPEAENSRIIIDLGHQIGTYRPEEKAEIKIINNYIIEGVRSTRSGKIWFVAEFNKPFAYYGTFDTDYRTPESDAGIFPYKNGEKGERIGAFVYYRTGENEQVLVKVGISYTGIDGARKNLAGEIPDWDFDRVKNKAREVWNHELSRIKIEGSTEEKKEIFYTALYHSLLAQYISQDVAGEYRGPDEKIHVAEGYDYYGSFSCWDTYRSQHPLLTLVAGEHVNDFIKSIESKTREYGWLPAQHFNNVFGESMVGDHLVPVIVDAFMKGYRDFDFDFLYDAMRTKALELPSTPVPATAGRSGLQYFMESGYIPVDKVTESVSKTLEMAYDDWCIAQMARELGKEDDYALFMKRAGNYSNLWDTATGFMRPRNNDGTWLEAVAGHEQEIVREGDHSWYRYFDPLLVGRRPNRHYTESNAWQYLWSVQHDIDGLIGLLGGKEEFISRLDTFFNMSPVITPPKYVGVVGTIGQYVHGNQPSHHVAYLYNYAAMPWKTQERVRQVCEELYRSGPGGLCGNEDMGSLSSWYVLSAMGLYQVTPGCNYYVIGSPLFGKATIDTGNGRSFSVEAINNSAKNIYIQSASLNGRPLNRSWISHAEITGGGGLVFVMGPEPARDRGLRKEDLPPSLR